MINTKGFYEFKKEVKLSISPTAQKILKNTGYTLEEFLKWKENEAWQIGSVDVMEYFEKNDNLKKENNDSTTS